MKIIYQQITADNKFILGLEGLSSETKPTGDLIADGSSFKETNTDAIYILDTTWKLAKAGQLKELPSVSAGDNGKIMKVADGAWGLGNDSGLPADFPEAGLTNAGKFVGFNDSTGAFEAKTAPSGGGAEKFVVTLTEDDSGAETVWTADKTIAEIIEAHADNELVVAQWEEEGATHEALLSLVQDSESESVVGFAAVDVENRVLTAGGLHDDADTWFVESRSIRNVALPEYSPSNNGQVLGISSGAPAWVYGDAPLIVTLTEDQNTGDLVGDKTYKEVYDAVYGGQRVMFKSAFGGFTVATNALSVGLSSGVYSVALVFGGSITETEGAENDNITITVGGNQP